MASKKQIENRKKNVVSARNRIEKHDVGGRGSVKLPEGASFFKVKEAGSKRVEIIPYKVGKGNPYANEGSIHFERTFWVHRGVGANSEDMVCNAKTFKTRCFLCEERMREEKKAAPNDEVVKSLAPKERQLWNILDHSEKDKGIQIWDQSYHLFGKFLDEKIKNADEEDGYQYFADLESGFTLKIGCTQEKNSGYTFIKCSDIEFKARKEALPESMLEEAYCLDELIKEVPYDLMKRTYLQIGDDEEEEETSKHKSNGKANSKKQKDDDDDEEEDTDQDEDEEADDEDDDEVAEASPSKAEKGSKKQKTAKELGLKVGDQVAYMGTEFEISKISADGTSLVLQGEDGDVERGISPSKVEKIEVAPKKGGKKIEDDEDEDEEEVVEAEDEEEEELPKKRKRK
jgi:hypothetical protein